MEVKMEVEESTPAEQVTSSRPSGGAGHAEEVLKSLKALALVALQECDMPLTAAVGSEKVRWEILSTWMLLLCIWYAEAEAERCRPAWESTPWRTEAHALRHIFLNNRSVRTLQAVLRWLRWVHLYAHRWELQSPGSGADADDDGGLASYERTCLQCQNALPTPALQATPTLHPDGPLQQRELFHDADLEDERRLLVQLWVCLRRGDLKRALNLCKERGQPWRSALLQGMIPFADSDEDQIGYDNAVDRVDEVEEMLAAMKADHTDWSELDLLSNGNPWRRLWKEQCWDTAQRNLQGGSVMDQHELAIYGFCAGHDQALRPTCSMMWVDRCWAELHCLKEWLIERLLDAGRKQSSEAAGLFLGEGDGGAPDVCDTQQDREARARKLCGKLHRVPVDELDAMIGQEVLKVLEMLKSDSGVGHLQGSACEPFTRLQATLIEAAWVPEQGEVALNIIRQWMEKGLHGVECPYLAKQFAFHFATWQQDKDKKIGLKVAEIDDIVQAYAHAVITVALSEQCLEDQTIELVADIVSALSMRSRLEVFSGFLLQLGALSSLHGHGTATADGVSAEELVMSEVLKQCVWAFWERFPLEVFALVATLVQKALALQDYTAVEEEHPDVGPSGVYEAARPRDMVLALRCLEVFWVVALDKAEDHEARVCGLEGLELVFAKPLEEAERRASADDFRRLALDKIVLPLTIDTFLTLTVKEIETALAAFRTLQDSTLWHDGLHSASRESMFELEWYLGLYQRHRTWASAFEETDKLQKATPRLVGFGPGVHVEVASTAPTTMAHSTVSPVEGVGGNVAQQHKVSSYYANLTQVQNRCSAARDALLDWARPRLAQDHALLEPECLKNTSISDEQWHNMRRTLACRSLFFLMSVFEQDSDFEGALQDLAVAVAQSPWMLRLLRPKQMRAFLRRFALIPT